MGKLQRILMSEGRRTQVVLLDNRKLDIVVQPRLNVEELLNIVASHCHLKHPDKQYFGLAYVDERDQYHWLQRERRVLEHEFPRKSLAPGSTLVLFHFVKFFVHSVSLLAHASTVELYFLMAKQLFIKGSLTVSDQDLCCLVGQLMHILEGDYEDDATSRMHIHNLQGLETAFAKRLGVRLDECEQRILDIYKCLCGASKAATVLSFVHTVERSPTYGMHFYEVKDKGGASWMLGINSKGIFQFELNDKTRPKKIFYWKHLENLYYRDKKFSIEAHDSKRVVHTLSSFNMYEDAARQPIDLNDDLTSAVCDPSTQVSVSRRAFVPSSVHVYAFFCDSAQLCKTLWSSAIAQHQFYLDTRTNSKKTQLQWSEEHLEYELERCMQSTNTLGSPRSHTNMSAIDAVSNGSSLSLPSIQSSISQRSDEDRQRDLDLYRIVKIKKEQLEVSLTQKLKELKQLCIREGEITGELPKEIKRALAPGEPEPKIKRRVGTTFAIPQEIMNKHRKADHVAQLEADVEVQRKIVSAASRLASDKSINKSVRRKRQKDYHSAHLRLRELEQRLHQLRLSGSKPDLNMHVNCDDKAWPNYLGLPQSCPQSPIHVAKSAPSTPHGSIPDLTDGPVHSRLAGLPPAPPRRPTLPMVHRLVNGVHSSPQSANSLPTSPDTLEEPVFVGSCASLPIYENVGYKSSSTYQSSYRNQNFPTLTSTEHLDAPNQLLSRHRTHSEHSLQSLPSVQGVDELEPLPDYRTAGADAIDHNIGAYNVAYQRTSWNYQSIEQGLNERDTVPALPKYGSGRVGAIVKKLSSSDMAAAHWTGSLDRRMNKKHSYGMINGHPPSPGRPVPLNLHTIDSPQRLPTPEVPHLQVNSIDSSIELSKPLETADVLRYNAKLRQGPHSPSSTSSLGSNGHRPVSPLVSGSPRQTTPRKPPPPYGARKLSQPIMGATKCSFTAGDDSECSNSSLSWYEQQQPRREPKKLKKKATIV